MEAKEKRSESYKRYELYRDRLELKDADVAKKTSITTSTFSDWKSGRSQPKIEKLRKIAAVLDCTIDDLIEG